MVTVLLLFQFGFILFLFLLWLSWLGLPKLCWMKVARVDILYFPWSYRKCFQLFTFAYDANCTFVIYVLYYVEAGSPYAHFLESFYHKWVLNLSKAFLASVEMIIWFLFFSLLMWCITLIDFWILKDPCSPGINLTWSWCMILLLYFCIWYASILLRIFTSVFIITTGL